MKARVTAKSGVCGIEKRRRIRLISFCQMNQHRRYVNICKSNIFELASRAGFPDPLAELLRTSSHQLLYQAVFDETDAFVAGWEDQRLSDRHFRVVLNGPSGRYRPAMDR